MEEQSRGDDKPNVFIVVQKYTVGGLHGRLRMPTIHAPPEDVFILARIPVCMKHHIINDINANIQSTERSITIQRPTRLRTFRM